MTLTLSDLDGQYRVTTVSDYKGPVLMQSDGITDIKDGKTNRIDAAGCEWRTELRILGDAEVELRSTADPANAKPDFCLTAENGSLTRDPVTYVCVLKVLRKDDKLRLSGQIHHGSVATLLTMTKV